MSIGHVRRIGVGPEPDHAPWTIPAQPMPRRPSLARRIGWVVAAVGLTAVAAVGAFRLVERCEEPESEREREQVEAARELGAAASVLAFSVSPIERELDALRPAQAAIRTDLGAIFVSLELSRRVWLITSLSPGAGEKMSKHSVPASDVSGLLHRFAELRRKAAARTGRDFPIIVIQEAGLDGFWIHRVLQSEGIESHVVDPASILTSRRRRRAKTDRIDGETLVRTLMAFKRGEPRVCSMARAPTPQEEDRRRVCRERRTLMGERVRHVNRIKGLLFAQGVFGYEPLRKHRRERLEDLRTGDGRPLPVHLKAQIIRELDRLEVVLAQLKSVAAERDALLKEATDEPASPPAMLVQLKGIGPETAAVLWSEGLFRRFDNRR